MELSITRWASVSSIVLLLSCGTQQLHAQWVAPGALVQIGGEPEERIRLGQLLGTDSTRRFLFRSVSSLSPGLGAQSRLRVTLFAPELRMVNNSALPFSLNDGPLWAGRGSNMLITAGVGLSYKSVRVIIAPQLTTSENLPFQVIPYPQNDASGRNVWSNPFHPAGSSIDLPLRFGDAPIRRVVPGQSSLTIDVRGVSFGVATENLWWGPGIRNAIVLSNNAEGFPHAFIQTKNAVRTPFGTFDAQWILGELRESIFFDNNPANDLRSLSGLIVVWTPLSDSGLSLGMARTVFAPAARSGVSLSAAFDFLRDVGHPNTDARDSAKGPGPDQVFSFFGRWVFPKTGFEAYAEWARFEEPISFRDLLEFPGHSQAYTLGLQWAHPLARGGTLRLQAEGSDLEPDPSIRVRPVATTYTSRSVVQGYTNLGKSLGANIGPGSSSQWLAADYFAPKVRFGVFVGRIRWDDATLWEPIVPQVKNEDISLFGGLRGSVAYRGVRLSLEYTHTVRLDYLYQDKIADPAAGTHAGVDIGNRTLSLTLSTAVAR
jgi:hypothetical protein